MQFLTLKYTLGIRLEEHEELEGCDKVDHNIEDMLIYKNDKSSSNGKTRSTNHEEKENFLMNPVRT